MKKKGNPGIYIILNTINNKAYIGASIDTYNRLCYHKVDLRNNNHDNIHLQFAYNKYGENNFEFDILENCDKEFIFSQENYWCNLLNTHNRNFGYNIDPTCPYRKIAVSDETKKRMSEKAEKRPVYVYTIYGEYFTKFDDLYKCGNYFKTAAANIHRKMNVLIHKKHLIDSLLTKYILIDASTNISDIKNYWNNIFFKLKSCKGKKYKIYDCFDKFIGTADSREICDILNCTISSISSSVGRGTYLKSLKITK